MEPLEPGQQAIFDIPAGAGYLHHHLPPGTHYVAVEPTAYFLDRCPKGAEIEHVRGSAERIPRPDGSADALISLAGLHHVADLCPVFEEFRRLLAPSRMLVVADVAAGSAPARFLNGYVHRHSPTGHEGRFLDETIGRLLREAGFRVMADEIVATPWHFADAMDAGHYCASLFGLENVEAGGVAAALDDIVGVKLGGTGFSVDWTLRRIVCRAL